MFLARGFTLLTITMAWKQPFPLYTFSLQLKGLTLYLKLYAIIKLDKDHSMRAYTGVRLSSMQLTFFFHLYALNVAIVELGSCTSRRFFFFFHISCFTQVRTVKLIGQKRSHYLMQTWCDLMHLEFIYLSIVTACSGRHGGALDSG